MTEIPAATYRIQFNSGFGFRSAHRIVPYLKKLGISDIYASPLFKAKKGSSHGYDVVDMARINPELGAEKDFVKLLNLVRSNAMGWVQDIVPNHMAFDSRNAWLMDVFEKGRFSPYYNYFDIEWKDTYGGLKGKVLAPFLGKFYSESLENQEIQLRVQKEGMSINYYDLSYPLHIKTYFDVLFYKIDSLKRRLGARAGGFSEYRQLADVLAVLTPKNSLSKIAARVRQFKYDLWSIYSRNSRIKKFVDDNILTFNGVKGSAESFDLLEQLLSQQRFRLSFWKFGAEEINYRRFFNINQLISIRLEKDAVFKESHKFICDLIRQGRISGLRVDHIDGLYHPYHYLKKLKKLLGEKYLVVEKILGYGESLPGKWPVHGTTGYDALNVIGDILCDNVNARALDRIYENFIGKHMIFQNMVIAKKRLIIEKHMAGDVENLAYHIKRISQRDRYGKDITLYGLKMALVEVLANFPIYRTYIESEIPEKYERDIIVRTVNTVLKYNPALAYELKFIKNILLLDFPDYLTPREKKNWLHFVMRFQQYTGPLMAKGFEDTTLYIYNRLISLNEVGSHPERFGAGLSDFHHYNETQGKNWPYKMNATATHDTKRGEDMRARIHVLSEIPKEWEKRLQKWQKYNNGKKDKDHGSAVPDANDEYFLYQTLLGSFPFDQDERMAYQVRLKNYIIKAVREAKVHTAWIQPDQQYEKSYLSFVERILKTSPANLFLKDFIAFQRVIASYGIYNSLTQTLLKMTLPGVPDFYQGSELWDLNFVDPDNRRPVDFAKREKLLNQIQKQAESNNVRLMRDLLENKEDGRVKLYLIWRILQLRKQNREVFQRGRYHPLQVNGAFRGNIVSFAREYRGSVVVIVAPRLFTGIVKPQKIPIGKVWKNTVVDLGKKANWINGISDEPLRGGAVFVKDLLKHFPCAVLKNIK